MQSLLTRSVALTYCTVMLLMYSSLGSPTNSSTKPDSISDIISSSPTAATANLGNHHVASTSDRVDDVPVGRLAAFVPDLRDPMFSHMEEEIPPSITNPVVPFQKVMMRDEDVTIKCTADGNPEPKYEWYRDGIRLNTDDEFVKAYSNGDLVLTSFMRQENGYYQCKAVNPLGTAVSQIIHLVAEQTTKGKDPTYKFTEKEGEPFNIVCADVPSTVPRMEKRWYINKNNELTLTKRMGVDLEGTLHGAYADPSLDNNVYICGLVPESGTKSSIILFGQGVMEVTPNTGAQMTTRPKLMYTQAKVQAHIGHSVTLQCFFASKPPADIIWLNSSNHQVTANNPRFNIKDFGRKMEIVKVQQQDEGFFTCRGSNDFGSTENQIKVNVTSAPLVVPDGVLTSRTVPDNTDIRLNCETTVAKGEHLETPMWYRNGRILTSVNLPDPSRYKFSPDFKHLEIKGLKKEEDTACFQCNSSNSEGYTFFDAYLRVINSIVVTKKPADVMVIEFGDVVGVEIHAKGDHCCKVNMLWHFNGTQIDPEQWTPFQRDLDTGFLIFNSSLLSEASLGNYVGTYTCRVSNQYQSVDVTFDITLKGSQPEPVAAAKTGMGLWWVGLLCGVLAILIAVIVVIVLYKSNYPRSTYKLGQKEIKHHLNPMEDLMNQSFQEI